MDHGNGTAIVGVLMTGSNFCVPHPIGTGTGQAPDQALIDGEQSGKPELFDLAAFKRRKAEQHGCISA